MDQETRVDDQRVATRQPTGNDPAGRGVRGPFGVGFGPPGSTDYIYKFTLKGVLFHFASTVGQFWVPKGPRIIKLAIVGVPISAVAAPSPEAA